MQQQQDCFRNARVSSHVWMYAHRMWAKLNRCALYDGPLASATIQFAPDEFIYFMLYLTIQVANFRYAMQMMDPIPLKPLWRAGMLMIAATNSSTERR